MRRSDEVLLGGAALVGLGALAVYLMKDETNTITGTVTDVFTRGAVVTSSHMGDDGVIIEDPDALIGLAAIATGGRATADVYCLARMMRSEGADQAEVRGHVALNDLRSLGWSSLQYLLTYSTAAWARGRFGKQFSAKYQADDGTETWVRAEAAVDPATQRPVVLDKQVRRYATTRDPYDGDILMAAKVISDRQNGIDPTQGAVKFLDRSALSSQEGASSFENINARWTGDGLIAYNMPQYGTDLVLYRKG